MPAIENVVALLETQSMCPEGIDWLVCLFVEAPEIWMLQSVDEHYPESSAPL